MSTTRRIIVLGSTGSIGVNTLAVIRHLGEIGAASFEVVALAGGTNTKLLAQQAREFQPRGIAVARPSEPLPEEFSRCDVHLGRDSALQLVRSHARKGDLVVGAMVGSAGIAPILEAINKGCDIALANKETLVAAGAIVIEAARRSGSKIIPVDSEHSAIMQCLRSGLGDREVRRIVLTASGGPFRTVTKSVMDQATLEDALKHPTWSMGRKVTIDSASMMNKALEIVEAHWLFDLPANKIDAIVHPQSIVHSFVEFNDSSVIAQLSPPDMRLPIQLALTWPARFEGCSPSLDWTALRGLAFEPVDHEKFPAIKLAWRVVEEGGTAGAILNGANEAAVEAFVEGRIPFGEISSLVRGALDSIHPIALTSLDQALDADRLAREWVASHASVSLSGRNELPR